MKGDRSENDEWLKDAEVQARIEKERGRWVVSLVFIDTKDPSHVLIREIESYRSKNLAEICAKYMKQTAERDPRGTQKVNRDDYDINYN